MQVSTEHEQTRGIRMGSSLASSPFPISPSFYTEQLSNKESGETIYQCSYEKWVNGASSQCGFHDLADYSTPRTDFRAKGFLLRPDVTDGRYLTVTMTTGHTMRVQEKCQVMEVEVPPCNTSGKMPQKLMCKRDTCGMVMSYVHAQTTRDGLAVVGCHENLLVVQTLNRKQCYVPEFYFIDLASRSCIGKFSRKDCELQWYECYISPDKTRIILRPDVSASVWTSNDLVKTHAFHDMQIVMLRRFPDSGGFIITFDNRHGNGFLFRAKEKVVQLFDLDDLEVAQVSGSLNLPAAIRQMKCSASGQFLSVRCAYPAYSMEYSVNTIAVISTDKLDLLFQLDVRGPYWPVSEVINLQAFPRFSNCDSAIAVMKNGISKRVIQVHKLPATNTSLLHKCRRVILRSTLPEMLNELPLPVTLIKYLKYQM